MPEPNLGNNPSVIKCSVVKYRKCVEIRYGSSDSEEELEDFSSSPLQSHRASQVSDLEYNLSRQVVDNVIEKLRMELGDLNRSSEYLDMNPAQSEIQCVGASSHSQMRSNPGASGDACSNPSQCSVPTSG